MPIRRERLLLQLPFAGIIQIRFKGFSHPAEQTTFDLGPLAIYCDFYLLLFYCLCGLLLRDCTELLRLLHIYLLLLLGHLYSKNISL